MFIGDLLAKRDEAKFDKGLTEAVKEFDRQTEALRNIADTDGMQVIMEYLETVLELCESRLEEDDSTRTFAKYKANKDLYRFLKSRISS